MADDGLIRVRASIDISGIKESMEQMVSNQRAQLAIMQEQYKRASVEIRTSVSSIVEAERNASNALVTANEAAVDGAEQVIQEQNKIAAAYQANADKERVALDELINEHQKLAGAINQLKAAIDADVSAKAADAEAAEALGAAHAHMVSEMQAASGEIRVFEGAMPIRAVERFAVSVLGLGPIMRAAFPAFGAIALGEVIFQTAEKVVKLYENFVHLKGAMEEIVKIDDELARNSARAHDEAARYNIERLRAAQQYVEAAKQERALHEQTPIEFPKIEEKQYSGLPKNIVEEMKSFSTQIMPADVQARIEATTVKLRSLGEQAVQQQRLIKEAEETAKATGGGGAEYGGGAGVIAEREATIIKAQQDFYNHLRADLQAQQEKLKAERQKDSQDIIKAEAEEQKKRLQEATTVNRQAAEDRRLMIQGLANADSEALAIAKSSHKLSVDEEISFWQKRLEAETQFNERYKAITIELGNLYQERARQTIEEIQKQEQVHRSQTEQDIRNAGAAAPEGQQAAARMDALQLALADAIGRLHSAQAATINAGSNALAGQVAGAQLADALESYRRLIGQFPGAAAAATKEANEVMKQGVDQQFEIWEAGGHRTQTQIIAFWQSWKEAADGNAPLIAEAIKRITEAQQKQNEEMQKAAKLAVQQAEQKAIGALDVEKEKTKRTETLRFGSPAGSELADLVQQREQDQQELNLHLKYAQEQLAIDRKYAADRDDVIRQDQIKIEQIRQQGAQKIFADTTAILAKEQQMYQNFFNTIATGFERTINAMITHHKSFASGMNQILGQMAQQFEQFVIKRVIAWVAGTALIHAAEAALNAGLVALHLAKATADIAIDRTIATTAGVAQITTAAAVGAANAAASTAMIPIAGPALAPAAAASMFAMIESFASLAAFETGGIIPNTGVALVHRGEGVMNERLTSSVLNMMNSSRGGDTNTMHITPKYSRSRRFRGHRRLGRAVPGETDAAP